MHPYDFTMPEGGQTRSTVVIEGITSNIAWYFFLAGAGSGAFMIHALMGLLASERRPRLTAASPAVSPALAPMASACLVLAGSLFLLADLGVPELFPLAIRCLGRSVISFGVLSITLFVIFATAYAAVVASRMKPQAKTILEPLLKWAAFAAALATAGYTGYYLFSTGSVDFWGSPLVILLFLASSLSTGSGVLMLLALLRHPVRRGARLKALCSADSAVIAVEIVTLAAFVASRLIAGRDAAALALEMVAGRHAALFWLGAVGLGLVAPLLLECLFAKEGAGETYAIAAALTLLAGGLALRCSIILV